MRISESYLKVLNLLWQYGDLTAKELANLAYDKYNWNKNTTYTVLNRGINKKYIERRDPNFVCHALISKENYQKTETNNFLDTVFDKSPDLLFSTLVQDRKMSKSEIEKLLKIIKD